jgi:SAM-dependent methyltransferase
MRFTSPSVLLAKTYLKLAPSLPAKHWTAQSPLERARLEYHDEAAGGFLKWFPEIDLCGLSVFDIGCGYGGRAARYRELGARRVVGLEIGTAMVEEARAFADHKRLTNMEFHVGEGENLPWDDDTFDLVTSYDVFEHVHVLEDVFDQCMRVLKPGGRLLAIFPPFFHPGGAHLDSWVSKMPWANVLFGRDSLIPAVQEIMRERNDDYQPRSLRPRDKLWTLNGATLRSVRSMLGKRKFQSMRMELAPLFSPMNEKWIPWKMQYYAPFFKPLRHMPLLNELFVHRIKLDITK